MSVRPKTDINAHVLGAAANAQATAAGVAIVLTAGATEDNVEVEGQTINRQGFSSCVVMIPFLATLAQDKTLSFGVKYQDSADGSTWNTAVVMQAATVAATGDTGGSNESGIVTLNLLLDPLAQYIRFNITPDMSATGTDTAVWAAACVLGGDDTLPAA